MAEPAQHPATSDRPSGPVPGLLSDKADTRRRAAVARRIARIARAIEADVVPRLVARALPDAVGPRPSEDEIERMAALAIADDVAPAIAFAEELRARGIQAPALLLHLLSPAALRLGDWWSDDRCTFVDVTLGLMHLQQVLQALSPVLLPDLAPPSEGRRILLLPAPGEQHTFGLSVVAEFFRRGGWDVVVEPASDAEEVPRLVRQDWFSVVGVSCGTIERAEPLAAMVESLRRASCNPDLAVLVGGPVFRTRPELARQIGADATAADGEQAVRQAEALAALLVARG